MFRSAFFLAVALSASPIHAAIDTLVPTPKRIEPAGETVPLSGFRIVAGNDERSRLGAAEINQRVRSLGGQAVPVSPLTASLPPGKLVVIAPCTDKALKRLAPVGNITPARPGPQGYVIVPVGSGADLRLFLVGSDPLGTLYAAVTMRQLIIRRGDQLVVQPARVTDWPDYKYRCTGTPFAEPFRGDWYAILAAEAKGDLTRARDLAQGWIARQKRYFDWMLRAKMNMAWNSTNIRPGDARSKTTVARAALKEVHQYALARGIESVAGDTTALGTYPADKDNPDFQHVVFHRSHKRYFCWSRLDYHRRRAERAAGWLADCGYTAYYLHSTDGGGWQNPELWDDRCPLCRKTYGDDRALADATVFNLYYDTIKRKVPNLKFIAVVYPYTGRYLDSDYVYGSAAASMGEGKAARQVAEQSVRKLTRFLTRLNKLLRPDIRVCVRESERRYFDLIRRAWGKRSFYTYYEYAYWKGFRPFYVTTPLWTKSLYDPDHDDILFGNVSNLGWGELTQLLGVECAWNVHRPGAAEFDAQRWRELGTRQPCPPERKTFARRACRFWFGEEAGPAMAAALAENLSCEFIAFPGQVLKYLDLPDPARLMRDQAAAAKRAAVALDNLWALQQRRHLLTGMRYGYLVNYRRLTHAAAILATQRAHMLAARTALRQGDRKRADAELTAARQALDQAAPRWRRLQKELPWKTFPRPSARKTSPVGYLDTLDLQALRKEVDDLWNRREAIIAGYTIPSWFARSCRKRNLVAVRATKPVSVDGRLTEPVWKRAPVYEHFVDYRVLRLEGLETTVRLAYDADTLYVAFDCFDPNPAEIPKVMPGRDRYVLCDSVEVLVAPSPQAKTFVHWIVDSVGTVFDARSAPDSSGYVNDSVKWNGTAKVAVVRGRDRWTAELALPKRDLGVALKRGGRCRVLLCRNIVHTRPPDQPDQTAVVFLDGSDFHTVAKFAALRLGDVREPSLPPQVGLVLRPVTFRYETTGAGSGTRLGGGLSIQTDRNLHNFRMTARLTDGVNPLGTRELGRSPLVELRWQPHTPFSWLVPREIPGAVCTFTLTSREGEWTFVRRFGSPRRPPVSAKDLYVPGVSGQALARPVFFPTVNPRTIHLDEGTIEFWVRPHWNVVVRSAGPAGWLEHTFLNLGPLRPDYPALSNHDSLTLSLSCGGDLTAILSNQNYESRNLRASLETWRAGQWHHVAFQWKLNDGGKTSMALYLDGRLASNRCTAGGKEPRPGALRMKELKFPLQLGSMNTGFAPADADFDELRISSVRRYAGPFTPAKRLTAAGKTLALFHFDGSLEAAVPPECTATPGPVQ